MSIQEIESKAEQNPQPELSVEEVFEQTFETLIKDLPHEIYEFPEPVLVQVADDSDWHRTRTGEMVYRRAVVTSIGDSSWILAVATETWGYPADRYSAEFVAIPCKAETKHDAQVVAQSLRDSKYFLNTLIVGLSGGEIAFSKISAYSNAIKESLGRAELYIAQDQKIDETVLDPSQGLKPVIVRGYRYKLELVTSLVVALKKVLS